MSIQRQEAVWIDDLGFEGDYKALEKSELDYEDLTFHPSISRLVGDKIPPDLIKHIKSEWFSVQQYYQVDNVPNFRIWKSLLNRLGGYERWLFYACPVSMIEDVLAESQPLPYNEFFPRVFGAKAIYLFSDPEQAARTALYYGLEEEGFLLSCRVITGKSHKSFVPNPHAISPPRGFNSILAVNGTDLGSGAIKGDLYAVYNPDQILFRFINHIKRSRIPFKTN
jgi:hypothetical protein